MKKIILIFSFVSILLLSCGNSSSKDGSGSSKTIRVGTVLSSSHPVNIALKEVFAKMVESNSNGEIKVQIYDSGVLGGEKQLYDSVRNGNVDLCAIGTPMWNEIEKLSIPDWPFIFRDLEHAQKVYQGEIGYEIARDLEEKGNVVFISWFPNGARVFSANRTISTLDDFKGLKMRMPNNPIHIQIGELLGCNVTPLPLGEVFSALEQRVVDGQDNPLSSFRSEGYYEVQTDVFESNHIIASIELMASKKLWNSLTPEQANIIKEAGLETALEGWRLYVQSIEDDKKFLEENGIKIHVPSEEIKNQMIEKMQPIYEELYKQYPWAEDMVSRIKAVQ
ncbi:TRAP transporter substrate-binding protein [Brachyspira pilosicoli]|uniref:TRAP transporter substrate-binding protein n=1 Tax=Brachyspira pilosicoli TaxID=52584 RepID=UPI0012F4914F|nr:TRAP transporter substrate-binding protein [Brachyspira pilosicoli]